MAPEARSGQDLGIGDCRDQKRVAPDQAAYRLIGRTMKSVAAIEEADRRVGVENYRHSSRSPSTRSRNPPPV